MYDCRIKAMTDKVFSKMVGDVIFATQQREHKHQVVCAFHIALKKINRKWAGFSFQSYAFLYVIWLFRKHYFAKASVGISA